MSDTLTPTQAVAEEFCAMLEQGQHFEAMQRFYADDVRHVEAMSMEGPTVTEGKAAVMEGMGKFMESIEVHGGGIGKPYPNGDQFIVEMWMDCTFKDGPMAGQRYDMREMALYTLKDGKVSEARFFYGA
jgi:ketosteroid isomerase-like protein